MEKNILCWIGYTIIRQSRFQSKGYFVDKEGHFIKIKSSILQEDIAILNVYAPNNRISKYVKHKLKELKR